MVQILITLILFAILHSILARLPIKGWFKNRLGERAYEGFYRISYNIVAVITFIPVLLMLVTAPSATLWDVNGGFAILLRVVQLIGLIGLSASLLQIDGERFLGTRQLRAYINGEQLPLPSEPLQTGGVYAIVRHPLYFFSLLVLWFTPNMTIASLIFVVGVTLYFVFGSLLEERTMVKIFGKPYEQYQQDVAWMVPYLL